MKIYQIRGPLSDAPINLGTVLGNSNYYIRQIGMEHPYSIPILITAPKSNQNDPDIFLHTTSEEYNVFLKINNRTQYRIPDRGFLEFENLNAKAGNVTLKFNKPLTFYDCITVAYE